MDSTMTTISDGLPAADSIGGMLDELRAAVCGHVAGMRRFARRRVRDEALADDAVQDALLAALEGLPSFEGRASLRSWLYGILAHKIQDAFRSEGRYVRLADPGEGGQDGEGLDDAGRFGRGLPGAAAVAEDPLEAVVRRRFQDSVVAAVEQLPTSLRQVFLMQAIEGLPTETVCRTLGISEANCWVRLHRARRQLAGALATAS